MESTAPHHVSVPALAPAPLRTPVDFGLRSAERYFRDLVVPGLGRVWFTRQLTWSSAALVLHPQIVGRLALCPTATAISHGIEALATKLAASCASLSPRSLELSAPKREAQRGDWAFAKLTQGSNYVRNTHRLAASRAMRCDGGLGLARGSQFDRLSLEPAGRALADAFLQQTLEDGTPLSTVLTGWICGEDILAHPEAALHAALSAHHTTLTERRIMADLLVLSHTEAATTRRRLAAVMGDSRELPAIEGALVPALRRAGYIRQADQILAARAFGMLLDAAHAVVASVTQVVARDGATPVTRMARDAAVYAALEDAQFAAHVFKQTARAAEVEETSALYFAAALENPHAEHVTLRRLLQRVPYVVTITKSRVTAGPQFRVLDNVRQETENNDGIDIAEPDRSTFRLASFHSLLRDISIEGTF